MLSSSVLACLLACLCVPTVQSLPVQPIKSSVLLSNTQEIHHPQPRLPVDLDDNDLGPPGDHEYRLSSDDAAVTLIHVLKPSPADSHNKNSKSFETSPGISGALSSQLPKLTKSSQSLSGVITSSPSKSVISTTLHSSDTKLPVIAKSTNDIHESSANIGTYEVESSQNSQTTQHNEWVLLHSKNAIKQVIKEKTTSNSRKESPAKLKYVHDNSVSDRNTLQVKLKQKSESKSSEDKNNFQEYSIKGNSQTLQLAVRDLTKEGQDHKSASNMLLTIATATAATFSLGLILGIFCCCGKKQQSDENENAEKNHKLPEENDNKTMSDNKKPSEVFNSSDIPVGEKDLDDPVSIKDKIKAMDNMLIMQSSPGHKRKSQNLQPSPGSKRKSQNLQPSPDPANKRKSHNEINLMENKALFVGMSRQQPQITVSNDDVQMRDKTESKSHSTPDNRRSTADNRRSTADNMSKSDTQDDISDKIFDNVSMHSSVTSQPYNPDVVMADSDDEDQFGELQRGTVILKSFQRAKPPRNRSPATRNSKGKIRKSRPNQERSGDRDTSTSQSLGNDLDLTTSPSSVSKATNSKTNSIENKLSESKTNGKVDSKLTATKHSSLEKEKDKKSVNSSVPSKKMAENPSMTKSCDFNDFNSIMSQSVTSIKSDVVTQMKHDSPKSGRYAKHKGSPKMEVRNESPSRTVKSSVEREITEKESRNESPSRYKKNKDSTDSPVNKRRNRRKERDAEARDSKSERLSTDITEVRESNTSSAPKRLSGIPANTNNIFYLIDPTVKNKCKSVGDITHDDKKKHRKSANYESEQAKAPTPVVQASPADGATANQADGNTDSPMRRDITKSEGARNSQIIEQTNL